MTLVGGCSVCSAPALNACSLCGRLVCRAHYDSELGLCTVCKQRRGIDVEEDYIEDDMDE